jgi:hypothetical protein
MRNFVACTAFAVAMLGYAAIVYLWTFERFGG